jgi:hypothetical protein
MMQCYCRQTYNVSVGWAFMSPGWCNINYRARAVIICSTILNSIWVPSHTIQLPSDSPYTSGHFMTAFMSHTNCNTVNRKTKSVFTVALLSCGLNQTAYRFFSKYFTGEFASTCAFGSPSQTRGFLFISVSSGIYIYTTHIPPKICVPVLNFQYRHFASFCSFSTSSTSSLHFSMQHLYE